MFANDKFKWCKMKIIKFIFSIKLCLLSFICFSQNKAINKEVERIMKLEKDSIVKIALKRFLFSKDFRNQVLMRKHFIRDAIKSRFPNHRSNPFLNQPVSFVSQIPS